ncbi:GH25 family lysozyme [Mesorhizobium sp. SP-1A]|uniref:glycoside hydrolase family 25 protein n=1 Tax=Mesorhizobium sp. SP-1A TaxID=3077840 RepID=UPI0028F70D42|nr:GH25 family lysozyme [Mesorhizobium sp. SP-1A]
MRFFSVPSIVLVCLGVAGCTSSSRMEEILSTPSLETTSSISRPDAPVRQARAPVPPAAIAEASPAIEPPAPVPMAALVSEQAETVPMPIAELPVPQARPVAMLAPGKPAVKAVMPYQIYSRRFRDAKPINFGSRSPRKLAVHGVDVSRWQGEIDWLKLRSQGANFAYIKATDGGDHLDPMFRKNWRGAADAGLKRGAYHFFYWCRTAGEQADWFIRNVPRVAGALPPVIDVEWNGESSCRRRPSRETVLEKMQVFMDKLERHYGQRPVIYTAPDFYRDNLEGAFPNHHFWLRSVAAHPSKIYPGRRWMFWQYSGSGLSHGVSGKIDLNVFHGSEDEWHDWVSGAQS